MRIIGLSGLAMAAAIAPAMAHADCKLLEIAEFHLDPAFTEPVVDGAINGKPIKVMFDTGASFSLIPRHEAEALGLVVTALGGQHAYTLGGPTDMYATRPKTLRVDKFEIPNPPEFQVAGDADTPTGVGLILGDDFFSRTDVELDLADKVVRLFRPEGCQPQQLVYWGAAYSQATLLGWSRDQPALEVNVTLDGKPVLAALDTGASESVVDVKVADADGVQRHDTGEARGLGPQAISTWSGEFGDFALGDEKVRHVRLDVVSLVSSFDYSETGSLVPSRVQSTPQMLIGDDFLHAHRVYVDVRDRLVLFSYQGGPVFTTQATAAPMPQLSPK